MVDTKLVEFNGVVTSVNLSQIGNYYFANVERRLSPDEIEKASSSGGAPVANGISRLDEPYFHFNFPVKPDEVKPGQAVKITLEIE